MTRLRLGSRGSALARAQSREVAVRLSERHPGLAVETVIIQTSGDRFAPEASGLQHRGPAGLDPALDADATPEGVQHRGPAGLDPAPNFKAMFVKEIEEALLRGEIDLGVHSAKDLPADLPEGLEIGAYPEREDPRDVFIGRSGLRSWKELPLGAVVGTASARRSMQLGVRRPDIKFQPMRGNVDTRLRKLEEGAVDGLLLAAAGLKRLGKAPPLELIGTDVIVPAPGQGALALEIRSDRRDVAALLAGIDHAATRLAVELEREFMSAMGGGCAIPLGAYARADGGGIALSVFWADAAGSRRLRFSGSSGPGPAQTAGLVADLKRRCLAA